MEEPGGHTRGCRNVRVVQAMGEEQAGVPACWELRGGEDQKLVLPLALQKHQTALHLLSV